MRGREGAMHELRNMKPTGTEAQVYKTSICYGPGSRFGRLLGCKTAHLKTREDNPMSARQISYGPGQSDTKNSSAVDCISRSRQFLVISDQGIDDQKLLFPG